MRGEPRAALDEQERDVVARELERGGQPGRAGADDQHGDVGVVGSMGAIVRAAGGAAHEQRLLKSASDCAHAVAVHRARRGASAGRRGARGRLGARRRDRRAGGGRQDAARGRGGGARAARRAARWSGCGRRARRGRSRWARSRRCCRPPSAACRRAWSCSPARVTRWPSAPPDAGSCCASTTASCSTTRRRRSCISSWRPARRSRW